MKKIIYIILFAISGSLAVTACTEEQVAPASKADNGGGAGNTGQL